ncbi:protein of unknown function [Shewanella benthica]|uniref:Uncharacterized protein n=1 Tax=Shewanella benthica TaxID=43661 RepID=A0A330M1D4_9GAMM|nr:protein of unknown function [Shewanella benthica]
MVKTLALVDNQLYLKYDSFGDKQRLCHDSCGLYGLETRL